MTNYARMYRLGFTPWERYASTTVPALAAMLGREAAERTHPPGLALDLGCRRGLLTPELARHGWRAVGVDAVPSAIDDARRRGDDQVTYVVGDVTDLGSTAAEHGWGAVDLFLDVGCFQGLDPGQRAAAGRGVTRLAAPGATVLMLAFGPSRWLRLVEGVGESEIVAAFDGWELLDARDADTAGLGWPMNRTRPRWYRLRRVSGPPGS